MRLIYRRTGGINGSFRAHRSGDPLRPLALGDTQCHLRQTVQLYIRSAGRREDVEGVARVPLDRPIGRQSDPGVDLHGSARRVHRGLHVDELGVHQLGVT